jgi:hypothetical protein
MNENHFNQPKKKKKSEKKKKQQECRIKEKQIFATKKRKTRKCMCG